jgi:pyruvate kinase
MSRVKIMATIGPKTANADSLKELQQAGMDIARLNGSHADFDWHSDAIKLIRHAVPGVPILLDLPGNKIRTTGVTEELPMAALERVVLTSETKNSTEGRVMVNFQDLPQHVSVGDNIVMGDGGFALIVDDITSLDVVCHAAYPGIIKNGQGVHLPGHNGRLEFLSQRDRELIDFAAGNDVDFIGLSFVETADDVREVRKILEAGGPQIVAKVETSQSLTNLQDLLEVSDVLMIDRGDLSVETRPETVALLQKHVLEKANEAAVPVIVATEILQSMIEQPVPTKAEISDITNLVLDGASVLMLSGETAVGKYPVETVSLMRRVADTVSASVHEKPTADRRGDSVPQAIGEAIALICQHLEVTKIVAITISGYAARMIAAKTPQQPILAVSNDPTAARRFNLWRGVQGKYVDVTFARNNLDHIPQCLEALWRVGDLVDDDLILVTAVGYPNSGNRMNLIETHRVADLRANLGWK